MSNPRVKLEKSIAKDIRQGIIEVREKPIPSKKHPIKKPWKVMYESPFGKGSFEVYRAITEKLCEDWIEKQKRSWIGYNISVDERYWIKGPEDKFK